MKEITPLEEADLRVQMRSMYNKIGFQGSLQCLYEMMKGCNILIEVIIEELKNARLKN